MKNNDRMPRVNEILKREISEQMEKIIRPEVQGLITVTSVKTAPDLRDAIVWVSFLGEDSQKIKLKKLLQKRRAVLQHEVMRKVTLKYTPRLDFRFDNSLAEADKISKLLDNLEIPEDELESDEQQ